MNCPTCGHDAHRVLQTNTREDRIQRTRECNGCGHRWHTIEALATEYARANDIVAAFERLKQAIPGEA